MTGLITLLLGAVNADMETADVVREFFQSTEQDRDLTAVSPGR